jgi:hypothetical protein
MGPQEMADRGEQLIGHRDDGLPPSFQGGFLVFRFRGWNLRARPQSQAPLAPGLWPLQDSDDIQSGPPASTSSIVSGAMLSEADSLATSMTSP